MGFRNEPPGVSPLLIRDFERGDHPLTLADGRLGTGTAQVRGIPPSPRKETERMGHPAFSPKGGRCGTPGYGILHWDGLPEVERQPGSAHEGESTDGWLPRRCGAMHLAVVPLLDGRRGCCGGQ